MSNPFEEDDHPYASSNKSNAPALPSKNKNYTSTGYDFSVTEEGIRQKEIELKRKEEDIERREGALLQQEEKQIGRVANWPPIRFLCFRPIFRNAIAEDMERDNVQRFMRFYWGGWYVTSVCFILNFASVIAGTVISSADAIGGVFLALAYMIIGIPVSLGIYRVLYRGARRGKASLYFLWFILIWISIIAMSFFAVGLVQFGGGGFILMINGFRNENVAIGVIALISCVCWVFMAVWHFYIFILARIEYGNLGGFLAAKKETAKAATQEALNHPELLKEGAKVGMNAALA